MYEKFRTRDLALDDQRLSQRGLLLRVQGSGGRACVLDSITGGVKLRCGSGLGAGVGEGELVGFHMSVKRVLSGFISA